MNLSKFFKDFLWALTAFKTIDNLPDSVIFTDKEGYITNFNKKATEVFKLDKSSDAPQINISNIIKDGTDCVKTSAQDLKPVLAKAFVASKEFYVELNAVKKGSGYCVNLRDMTKLAREIDNEDKILKFNNEKNAMLAKLEGDLKAPLTSISGFSQGLLDGLGGNLTEKQAKYVKIIHSNAEELHTFIDKLVEFSTAESLIYEDEYQKFDIIETIKSVLKEVEQESDAKKLTIGFDYNQIERRMIYSDINALKRIIKNILETAIPMTEKGGITIKLAPIDTYEAEKYHIDLHKINSYLHISIVDSGCGISDDEMRFLCEPYAQLEKGKKNFLRALRLGSATILARRAGGFIRITSELMKGTGYDIILPIEKV